MSKREETPNKTEVSTDNTIDELTKFESYEDLAYRTSHGVQDHIKDTRNEFE